MKVFTSEKHRWINRLLGTIALAGGGTANLAFVAGFAASGLRVAVTVSRADGIDHREQRHNAHKDQFQKMGDVVHAPRH